MGCHRQNTEAWATNEMKYIKRKERNEQESNVQIGTNIFFKQYMDKIEKDELLKN